MRSTRAWENIYLRCLELDNINNETDESLIKLMNHLVSIVESIPDDVDPANDFEMFVAGKLCESTGRVINNFLSSRVNALKHPI